MDFRLAMGLRMVGATEDDMALLEKELPDIENLIAVFRSHQAQINRVLQLLEIAQRLIHNQQGPTL